MDACWGTPTVDLITIKTLLKPFRTHLKQHYTLPWLFRQASKNEMLTLAPRQKGCRPFQVNVCVLVKLSTPHVWLHEKLIASTLPKIVGNVEFSRFMFMPVAKNTVCRLP